MPNILAVCVQRTETADDRLSSRNRVRRYCGRGALVRPFPHTNLSREAGATESLATDSLAKDRPEGGLSVGRMSLGFVSH